MGTGSSNGDATAPSPGHLATRPSSYIPTLDGWRAVAILLVMFYHDHFQVVGPRCFYANATLSSITKLWGIGVDIFFALSGFLICSRLLAERRKTGRIDLRGFYIRRFFRILPPYLTYLLVVGLLGAAGVIALNSREYLSSFLFLRNYLPESDDGLYTRHFWSLAVEEHFYLIWPGLLMLIHTGRRARWAAFGLGMLVTVWRGVDSHWHLVARAFGPDAPGNFMRTDTRLDGLVFGCWIALLVDDPTWRARLTRWLSPAVWWAMVAALLVVLYSPRGVPVARLWLALLIPLILAGTVLRPESLVGRIFEWGPLRWVGRISYSLYLWQQMFLVPSPGPTPLGWLQSIPFDWLAVFGCAMASYTFIEKPLVEVGRLLSGHHGLEIVPVSPAGALLAGRSGTAIATVVVD